MNDSNPVYFTLIQQGQVQQVPTGWTDRDVGDGTTLGVAGSASYEDGTFTVNGSGAGVWNTKDGFNFYYQSLSGDGTIIARLLSASGGGSSQSTGIMIRETLFAYSTNVYTLLGGGNSEVYVTARTSTSGSTSVVGNTSAVTFPYWVKLVRSSNNFTGYSSSDGVNWTQVGTTTVSMAQNAYVGLAVSSDNTGNLTTATFANVSITSSTTSSSGTLVGSVTSDSGGAGINGAQVQALQQGVAIATTSTNSSGAYTLANLVPGTYDLKFSASGFGTLLKSGIFVAAAMTETVNASLSAPGSISGTVTQSDGVTPISGAIVQASVGSALGSSATTNSSGSYSITGLNEGSYAVQASASGYTTTTQSASVTANSATTANFSLLVQSSGASSYVYDALGRLVAVILQSGGAAVYNYDPVGNLLSISHQSANQLSILSFSPTLGPVGSTVTIYGTAFSTTPNQNTVKFNGIAATVQSATATQLVVSVPTGATTGPISVTVSGNTVTSSASFAVSNP
jgi:YD repeat-containing protein